MQFDVVRGCVEKDVACMDLCVEIVNISCS